MNKQHIQGLIAQGKLEKAMEQLLTRIQGIPDGQTRNDLLLQSSRLQRILREQRLGVVSGNEANVTLNQLTHGLLAMVDELPDEQANTLAEDASEGQTGEHGQQDELLQKLSRIVGRSLSSLPADHRAQLEHQVTLYEIHQTNLQEAEAAAAKWGELAPPILIHRLKEGKEKLQAIAQTIETLL